MPGTAEWTGAGCFFSGSLCHRVNLPHKQGKHDGYGRSRDSASWHGQPWHESMAGLCFAGLCLSPSQPPAQLPTVHLLICGTQRVNQK